MTGYGLKYHAEDTSDRGVALRYELHLFEYAGASSARRLMDGGQHQPTGPSRGSIYKLVAAASESVALWDVDGSLRAESRSWQMRDAVLKVYEAGSLVWQGFVTPVTDRKPAIERADVLLLTARCGLADLRDEPLVDGSGNVYTGKKTLAQWIALALQPLGYSLALAIATNWRKAGTTGEPFGQIQVDGTAWLDQNSVPISCATVLQIIAAAFGVEIQQGAGMWWIVQRDARVSGNLAVQYYLADGTVSTTDSRAPVTVVVDNDDRGDVPSENVTAGLRALTTTYNHGPIPPLVANGSFSARSRSRSRGRVPTAASSASTRQDRGARATYSGSSRDARTFAGRVVTGQFTLDPTDGWELQDGSAPTLAVGAGLDGGNGIRLPSGAGTDPSPNFGLYFDEADDVYLTNKNGIIFNPSGKRIVLSATVQLRGSDNDNLQFPAYAEYRLVNQDGGADLWIAQDETLSTSRRVIAMGMAYNYVYNAQNLVPEGVRIGTAVTHTITTEALSSGRYRLEPRYYQAVDFAALNRLDTTIWSDITAELVNADGTQPTALVATAYNNEARATASDSLDVYLGASPVEGMDGTLYDASGAALSTLQRGAGNPLYAPHELCARERYAAQSVTLAHLLMSLRAPHAVPHCADTVAVGIKRYTVGAGTLDRMRGHWAYDLIPIVRGSVPNVVAYAEDDGSTSSLATSRASSSGIGSGGSDVLASLLGNVVALTTVSSDVAPNAALTSIPVAAIGANVARLRALSQMRVFIVDPTAQVRHEVTLSADFAETDTALGVTNYDLVTTINAGSFVLLAFEDAQDAAYRTQVHKQGGTGSVTGTRRVALSGATVNTFTGAYQGQEITVIGPGTLVNGSGIMLSLGADFTLRSGERTTLEYDGSGWFENCVSSQVRTTLRLDVGDPSETAAEDGDVSVERDVRVERDLRILRALNVGAPTALSSNQGDVVAERNVYSENQAADAGDELVGVNSVGLFKRLGILVSHLLSMAVAAPAAGRLLVSGGADKSVVASEVAIGNILQRVAAGDDGRILTARADGYVQDSGVNINRVPKADNGDVSTGTITATDTLRLTLGDGQQVDINILPVP